jgi:hypothetical protein
MRVTVRGRTYDVPKGYVLIDWVGEESPLDDEWVRFKLASGAFTVDQMAVLREMARSAIKPHVGHSRTFYPGKGFGEIPGLTGPVRFGHDPRKPATQRTSTLQMVTARDADLITQSASGNEFRVYDNEGEADVAPPRLIFPKGEVALVDHRRYGTLGDFRRSMGGWKPR